MALVYFPVLCNFYGEELRKLNFGITATDQIIDTIIFLCSVFFPLTQLRRGSLWLDINSCALTYILAFRHGFSRGPV
jgi:hypothetical protein